MLMRMLSLGLHQPLQQHVELGCASAAPVLSLLTCSMPPDPRAHTSTSHWLDCSRSTTPSPSPKPPCIPLLLLLLLPLACAMPPLLALLLLLLVRRRCSSSLISFSQLMLAPTAPGAGIKAAAAGAHRDFNKPS